MAFKIGLFITGMLLGAALVGVIACCADAKNFIRGVEKWSTYD